jgi:hypothetical protein
MEAGPPKRTWSQRLCELVLELGVPLLLGAVATAAFGGLEKLGVPRARSESFVNVVGWGLGAVAVGFVLHRRAKQRLALRSRHMTPTDTRNDALRSALPLVALPSGPAARSIRSASLFALALLFCFAPIACVLAWLASPVLGLAVGGLAVWSGSRLVRAARDPVPALHFTGDRIRVGSRQLSLDENFACSFPDHGGIGSWIAEATGAPAVVVRTRRGEVRFRPGRYERVSLARLAHALVARASDGDARAWLVDTWPLPPPDASPKQPGPWMSPVVAAGVGLVFLLGSGLLVMAVGMLHP